MTRLAPRMYLFVEKLYTWLYLRTFIIIINELLSLLLSYVLMLIITGNVNYSWRGSSKYCGDDGADTSDKLEIYVMRVIIINYYYT
jgi:hypothetical protein